jgi:bacterioferritin
MQSDPKIINTLNSLLADELTAINQYMVHAEMCENWGYDKLGGIIQKRAIEEMKHAERLIGRILFLEGTPVVNELRKITIGAEVPKMFSNDHGLEDGAIKSYNSAIALCMELKDNATKDILQSNLNDEDRHIDGIEEIQDEINQMGLQIFLSTKTN